MDDLLKPLVNVIPEKWRMTVTIVAVASPYLTRAYYAITTGGGIRGIARSIWWGTNTPKTPPADPPPAVN